MILDTKAFKTKTVAKNTLFFIQESFTEGIKLDVPSAIIDQWVRWNLDFHVSPSELRVKWKLSH